MKNFILEHRKYFVVALAVILLVIIFALIFVSMRSKATPTEQQNHISINPTAAPAAKTPLPLDDAAEGRLAQVILHRPPLSQKDTQNKDMLLNSMLGGPNSGVLYISNNVQLQYVQDENLFMAEITTTNITQAKTEVANWLRAQGISKEGICKLPVMFYLNPEISQQLQGQNIKINPLPIGC